MGPSACGQQDPPFLQEADGLCLSNADPQAWAGLVSQLLPVRICEPLHGRGSFHNRTALMDLGDLTAVATAGTPIAVRTDDHSEAHLMLPYAGNGHWTVDGRVYDNPAGASVLFLPPAPLLLENSVTSGVSLNIPPERLLRTAVTMAGPEGIGRDLGRLLQQPRRLSRRENGNGELIACLYDTLATAERAVRVAAATLPMLRFDDLLIRLTLLLLVPELRSLSPPATATGAERRGEVRLDDLIAWIEAHLERPLSLSDLEARAHCSRRTLQLHFRRRFGCSPMQWLRMRRMRLAMERLRRPRPGDSVWSVAQACGYSNLSAFSREFRARHGQRPSEVLRRARLEDDAEA